MCGAVVVGEGAVGVEVDGEPVGYFFQLVGSQHGGFLGEEGLGFVHRGRVNVVGEVFEEFLDGAQMLYVEQAGVPGLGGRR